MTQCRAPARLVFYVAVVAIVALLGNTPVQAQNQQHRHGHSELPTPVMENDSMNLAQSGSIKLSWHSTGEDETAPGLDFVLQEATNPGFTDAETYYRGPDLATYISGLPEGIYYYRVRLQGDAGQRSAWSDPVVVEVEHHSLSLAWFLFAVGGLVFALTVTVVVRGARNDASPDRQIAAGGQ